MVMLKTLPRWAAIGLLMGLLGIGVGAAAGALTQSAAMGLRLYVLDCGTLIYNNPETYNLTRQEVKNTNMSVPCYLIVRWRLVLAEFSIVKKVISRNARKGRQKKGIRSPGNANDTLAN